MTVRRRFRPERGLWALAGLLSWTTGVAADSGAPLTFERDIRPIFKVACFHCHGEGGEREGGLDIRLVRLMVAGGESGTALVPGDPEASLLWQRLEADEMPKGEKKLTASEKEQVRRWIAGGASTARPEPDDVEDARFTEEERAHWAFQPVTVTTVPVSERGQDLLSPVDAFVAARLEEEIPGVGLSAFASRRTLIRRVTLDLTGLPPDPEEVEAFAADEAPDAYERLTDRLLASPQFGVRWGRHWLDVAGYAESEGGAAADRDPVRPHAWRYRDYVIGAFNRDLPVDRFLREQLAGDELIDAPLDPENARQEELLTATGFLRMAPDPTGTSNTVTDRNLAVANTVQVVSSAVLGLTIGCAQCHDHKYDPIGIDDYYRFRAIFDPAFPLESWKPPAQRLVDMTSAPVRREAEAIEQRAQALEADLKERRLARAAEIQEEKLAHVPETERGLTREAVKTQGDQRTAEQIALLDRYPMVKPLDTIVGLLVEYDGAAFRAFEKEQEAIAALRATKPPMRMIMTVDEPGPQPPVSHVFFRGDPEAPREAVEPGELRVLPRPPELPLDDPARPTTGRRLAYARHLTDGQHPLTARVFVNRLWMHHLGRGLVATPGDFGINGERPSHPRLLDWLAKELVDRDWHQKVLHRTLAVSATYRQESTRRPELERLDPENALFGRANLRRLEAESMRDALLAVSDQLDAALAGPSVAVAASPGGKAVLSGPGTSRRSVYVQVQRSLPLDVLGTFDQPVMSPNCDQRRQTTVTTQALWFLNDESLLKHAAATARRVQKEAPEHRLDLLHRLLFAQSPNEEERRSCRRFLQAQTDHFAQTEDPAPEDRAWELLCQVLLASNRFLYVD